MNCGSRDDMDMFYLQRRRRQNICCILLWKTNSESVVTEVGFYCTPNFGCKLESASNSKAYSSINSFRAEL
jgi:hypothetical protein